MNINDAFKRKQPARKPKPGGLTQAQADAIEQEFLEAMEPLGQKATEYFRHFIVNGKHRFWLLPAVETYADLPLEKMQAVLKYKNWFVSEIAKQELDDLVI